MAKKRETARPGPAATMAPTHKPRPHRYVTLEELLIWVYRDQKAPRMARASLVDLEMTTDGDEPYHRASTDGVCTMQRIASVGARIQGSTCWGASAVYHPDCDAVMDALTRIGWAAAGILINYAETGDRPECSDATPIPHPMRVASMEERYGQAKMGDGRQIIYRMEVVDREFVKEPIYDSRRKKGVPRIIGYETKKIEVLACPLDWWPTLNWVKMQNAIHDQWVDAINALWRQMQAQPMKDHTLTGMWVSGDAGPIERGAAA